MKSIVIRFDLIGFVRASVKGTQRDKVDMLVLIVFQL